MPFNTSEGLAGPVYFLLDIFNQLVPVFVAGATVLFMLGVVRYIYSEGEHKDRSLMLWSLVVLFIMLSMWGTLRLLCSTFTGSASCGSKSTSSIR